MSDTNKNVSMRFNALVKALGYNISSFARALGYERSDKLYNIQKGKYCPSFEILYDITKNFVYVNVDWLITGKGSMFKDGKGIEDGTPHTQATLPAEKPVNPVPDPVASSMSPPSLVKELLDRVAAQAEEIGMLKQTINQLEREKEELVSVVNGFRSANVG